MEKEKLDGDKKPHWTKPVTTNFIGIDLSKFSESQLAKLIELMDEVNYTPFKAQTCRAKDEF